jgi:hypothetical protein
MPKNPEKLAQEVGAASNPEIDKTTEALRSMAAAESGRPEVFPGEVVEDKNGSARELTDARNTLKKAFAEKEQAKPKSAEDYPEDIRGLGDEILRHEQEPWSDTKDMFRAMGGELKRAFYAITGRSKKLPQRPETVEDALRQKLIERLGPDKADKAEAVQEYMDKRNQELDEEYDRNHPDLKKKNEALISSKRGEMKK